MVKKRLKKSIKKVPPESHLGTGERNLVDKSLNSGKIM